MGGERPILGRRLDCSAESGLRHCPAGVSRPGPRLSSRPPPLLAGSSEASGSRAGLCPEACEVRRPRAQRPTHTSTPSPAERPESRLYLRPDLGGGGDAGRPGFRGYLPWDGKLGEGAA